VSRVKRKKVSQKDMADINDKVDYLKKKMKQAPFSETKEAVKEVARSGCQYIKVAKFLKTITKDETFDAIMSSKLFSQIEKDFILFNINNLETISRWPYWRFNLEVGTFALEVAGVEFEDEDNQKRW